MADAQTILKQLKALGDPAQIGGMARFGMTSKKRLGVSVPNMRKIAKSVGMNHHLANELWKLGFPETKIVAGLVADPALLTEQQMEEWVRDINSWDVCDQVCMNLFDKSPFVWKKIHEWSQRGEEFVKRTAFALIACIASHQKDLPDQKLISLFPVLLEGSADERNYVKKAVSWALRTIGKKNTYLNQAAVQCAKDMQQLDSKGSRWIASDVLRELLSEKVQSRLRSVKT